MLSSEQQVVYVYISQLHSRCYFSRRRLQTSRLMFVVEGEKNQVFFYKRNPQILLIPIISYCEILQRIFMR